MKTKVIGYWVTTAFLAFAILSGGAAELARRRENVEGLVHLGYPLYFVAILGLWKVLAGIALLVPRFPWLKEWAYAGIFFNMTDAALSHAVCGDVAWHVMKTSSRVLPGCGRQVGGRQLTSPRSEDCGVEGAAPCSRFADLRHESLASSSGIPPFHSIESPHYTTPRACTHRNEARA